MCENDPRNHPPFNKGEGWEAYISGRPGVMNELRNLAIWQEARRRLQEGRG